MTALLLVFVSCFSLALARDGTFYPFQNNSLSFEERVKDIVDRLSLQELVEQMAHGGAGNNGPAPGIDRLGIKPYQWGTECLSGDVRAGNATSFPISIGMAATFNYDTVYQVTKAVGEEVRAKNINATSHDSYAYHTGLSCWSPVINIMRDPRWGRNQETYGEDPYLSGHLARAYVTGLQGDDPKYIRANAGCKHFDVHGGPEDIPVSRLSFDSKVSMKDWRMTFLPQFKACVEAGAPSLMCSYNRINGVPACANKVLLTDILRNEWGFTGYVVSDQGALENIVTRHHYAPDYVTAAADAANAGTCLEDGDGHETKDNVLENLEEAFNKGLVSMDTLKDAVSRLFLVRMKLGEFDPDLNPYTNIPLSIIQGEAHIKLSLQAAMESIVLLKNDENKGLPMDNIEKACLVGPFIDDYLVLFGDYSPTKMTDYITTPLAGLQNTKIGYKSLTSAAGCRNGPACDKYDSDEVQTACADVDLVIVTAGLSFYLEYEDKDRPDISLPGYQLQLIKDAENASTEAPIVLLLFNAIPLDISYAKNNPRITSILEVYYPAQTGGEAIANVLTGKYNPAGRLPNTWPLSIDQIPNITNYTMQERTYRYFTQEPLYPFGYGLSYTTFKYSDLKVSVNNAVTTESNISVSATVSNTGKMDGDEVTQVYIEWDSSVTDAPIRQLVGVSRKFINQGESINVFFTIKMEQLQIWVDDGWITPKGTYTVSVGGQQPNQVTTVPSNMLQGQFTIS